MLKFLIAFTINPPGILLKGPATLNEVVNFVFTFLMYAVGVIGVVMMVYSGFMYVISVGRPEKTKLALQSIIYTAVGFGVAIMARSIVELIYPKVVGQRELAPVITESLSLFMWVIGIAAVIVIIVAAILYVISAGDPGRTKTAKDAIIYATVGLGVAVIGGAGIPLLNSILSP